MGRPALVAGKTLVTGLRGGAVSVHASAGISRSALGVAAVLALAWSVAVPESLAGQTINASRDSCLAMPDLGKPLDGSPVLATVVGRVFDSDGQTPLIGAHLQITGTRFGTFTDKDGEFRLKFDARILDRCGKRYVVVVAPGHADASFTLTFVGSQVQSSNVILRKH